MKAPLRDSADYERPGGPLGSSREWHKSSYSTQDECVEVSIALDSVLVRNSSNRTLPSIAFGREQWARFTAGIRSGEFD